jgi:hypothetical protein
MTKKLKMIATSDAKALSNATFASCWDMPIPESMSSAGQMIETTTATMLNSMYFAEPGALERVLRLAGCSSDASSQMDALC